ncbi:MAG: hypothetical protein DI589_06580 [Shinella sp.]|nr:MAG: hypothetical protein DI589_06580 [Shinella sp.]
MELATSFVSSIFGGGGAAASTAATTATSTATTAATAASGLTLKTLLQGTASVLGMYQAVQAGNADAEAANLAAIDAEREKPLETLQGINRRAGIKQEMMNRVGEQDVAYAASGVDLSFGTPGQARKAAFREADNALGNDVATEQTRIARLDERAANYRKRAARARAGGWFDALTIGAKAGSDIAGRY